MKQRQFLEVIDEAEAHRRFAAATAHLAPAEDSVPLAEACGRVLAVDVASPIDVPSFDRSNLDGFAVRAVDTTGAEELRPVRLRLAGPALSAGREPPPGFEVSAGAAVPIATGGVVPRGADAVLMIESTRPAGEEIEVLRPVAPGEAVTYAGSDIGRGDLVLLRRRVLTSRDTAVLAAVGLDWVRVLRRPRVAVISTGDEIVAPGGALPTGSVYDSNQRALLDAVAELGGEPVPGGVLPDDEARLTAALEAFLDGPEPADLVLLSGGTSKGEGDLNAEVVRALAARRPASPGVVAHGVALKPGKPVMLAVVSGKPVVVLPGFPTSAIFTFYEFVAPLIRSLAGLPEETAGVVTAVAPLRVNSDPGRTEYVLVDLVEGRGHLAAYPLGAGSGSVTAFGRADGFVRIPAATEYVGAGEEVKVRLFHRALRPADLVAIGSHCPGLDYLLGLLSEQGFSVKSIKVGSTAGLAALGRGEGDVAGIHLMDEGGIYNLPFLPAGVGLLRGYGRRQGLAFRRGSDLDLPEVGSVLAAVRAGPYRMVNRNPGSGTRVLIDRLLAGARPEGYTNQPRSHHAVAAAVAQGRADWGVTLDLIAEGAGLGFLFLQEEQFDLAVREDRRNRPAVIALAGLLADDAVRGHLREMGFSA